jgi:hypothetical protein
MKLPDHIASRVTWSETPKTQEAVLPSIVAIAPEIKECENGCGKIIDQHQGITVAKRVTPVEYWQTQCKVCKQFKNPNTGAYDCTLAELNAILAPNRRR